MNALRNIDLLIDIDKKILYVCSITTTEYNINVLKHSAFILSKHFSLYLHKNKSCEIHHK